MDLNQDGVFDENERIYYSVIAVQNEDSGQIIIPEDAIEGLTRMRVMIHWVNKEEGDIISLEDLNLACEVPKYGEVEDYCVDVCAKGTNTTGVQSCNPTIILNNPFDDKLTVKYWEEKSGEVQLKLFSLDGKLQLSSKEFSNCGWNTKQISMKNITDGIYFLIIESGNNTKVRKVLKTKKRTN